MNNVSEEYIKFVKEYNIRNLTRNESELLQLLVRLKIGGFEEIVKLYRNCKK